MRQGYTCFSELHILHREDIFDRQPTRQWLRASTACWGVLGPVLFVIALLGFFYHGWLAWLLYLSFGLFILGKILFIVKGYRIFSPQGGSYVAFLYYLCSVEIIPVAITWLAAENFAASAEIHTLLKTRRA